LTPRPVILLPKIVNSCSVQLYVKLFAKKIFPSTLRLGFTPFMSRICSLLATSEGQLFDDISKGYLLWKNVLFPKMDQYNWPKLDRSFLGIDFFPYFIVIGIDIQGVFEVEAFLLT
jgi:hypothetical protein